MLNQLSTADILALTNQLGTIYKDTAAAIAQANVDAAAIYPALLTADAGADPLHVAAYAPIVTGITGSGAQTQTTSPFGATSGVTPGAFGTGQRSLNLRSFFNGNFNAVLEYIRKDLTNYAGATGVSGLPSYAIYQNGLTPFSVLYTPAFASLFWQAYNQGLQLDPSTVFAPAGIVLATYAIAGAGAGTLTAGSFPRVNGYTSPAHGTDSYGNPLYVGGMPMAQGFAPLVSIKAHVTTAINGTCAAVVAAPDQNGTSQNWTATLDNHAVSAADGSTDVAFTGPAGKRIGGVPTGITFTGAATAGAFTVVSTAERAY